MIEEACKVHTNERKIEVRSYFIFPSFGRQERHLGALNYMCLYIVHCIVACTQVLDQDVKKDIARKAIHQRRSFGREPHACTKLHRRGEDKSGIDTRAKRGKPITPKTFLS